MLKTKTKKIGPQHAHHFKKAVQDSADTVSDEQANQAFENLLDSLPDDEGDDAGPSTEKV